MPEQPPVRAATPSARHKAVTLLGMLVAPFIVETGWLYLSRVTGFPPNTANADTLGLGLGVAVGCLSMFRLRLDLMARVFFLVAYIVASVLILFAFGAAFVCSALRVCL